MAGDSPEHRELSRRGWGCAALVVLVLPVVYVLSVPFALMLAYHVQDWTGVEMETPFIALYTPLIYLYDRFESVRSFFDWYFEPFPDWMQP